MGRWLLVQAEGGMRDVVRSRGLGEVYRRQVLVLATAGGRDAEVGGGLARRQVTDFRVAAAIADEDDFVDGCHEVCPEEWGGAGGGRRRSVDHCAATVSYNHLTLPTSDLVQISGVPVSLKKKNTSDAADVRSSVDLARSLLIPDRHADRYITRLSTTHI